MNRPDPYRDHAVLETLPAFIFSFASELRTQVENLPSEYLSLRDRIEDLIRFSKSVAHELSQFDPEED